MKPRIGVSTSERGGWRSFLAIRFAVWRSGGKAIRITANRQLDPADMDGLIAGGGDDISADLYGGQVVPDFRIDPERDALEVDLIPRVIDAGLPVLGICRGSQMVNVALGGTLHGDIYEVFEDARRMRTVLPKKRIEVEAGSRLHRILECENCLVNTLHHQAVDTIGEGMKVTAREPNGIIQATESADDRSVLAVQWHPELMPFSNNQVGLFKWLVQAAKGA